MKKVQAVWAAHVAIFCSGYVCWPTWLKAEPTSISDAYAIIKKLTQDCSGTKIYILVNMAESRAEARRVYQRLSQTANKVLSTVVYDAGYILCDEHVSEAVRQTEPLVLAYPRC